jgi:predicted MFS family arabinose efflux permease
MFVPIALGSVVFLLFLGPLYNHRFLPPRWVLVVGELLVLAGEIMFSQNDPDTSYWRLSFPGFILIALGSSCYFVNFLNIIFSSAPPDEQGLISGLIQTVAQISIAMTFAVGSSLVRSTQPAALLSDYRNSFYFCAGCTGLAALVSALFLRPVDMKAEASCDKDEKIGQRLPLTDVMGVSGMHTA